METQDPTRQLLPDYPIPLGAAVKSSTVKPEDVIRLGNVGHVEILSVEGRKIRYRAVLADGSQHIRVITRAKRLTRGTLPEVPATPDAPQPRT